MPQHHFLNEPRSGITMSVWHSRISPKIYGKTIEFQVNAKALPWCSDVISGFVTEEKSKFWQNANPTPSSCRAAVEILQSRRHSTKSLENKRFTLSIYFLWSEMAPAASTIVRGISSSSPEGHFLWEKWHRGKVQLHLLQNNALVYTESFQGCKCRSIESHIAQRFLLSWLIVIATKSFCWYMS